MQRATEMLDLLFMGMGRPVQACKVAPCVAICRAMMLELPSMKQAQAQWSSSFSLAAKQLHHVGEAHSVLELHVEDVRADISFVVLGSGYQAGDPCPAC